ncbi:MAG TPA: hypothetical protein VN946_02240 [Terriglobales bacterium]|jgi:hypothetical protein|nr:hypothetical protein [Terriglobales bacterium]
MKNTMRMLSLALCVLPMYLHAGTGQDLKQDDQPAQGQNARSAAPIPAGTIIPVSLNSTLRSDKSGSGDAVTATVMQDVIVGSGETLRKGSMVTGHVIETVVPGNRSDESKISFQFDQVQLGNRTVSMTTNLRAVASKHAVLAATPQLTSSEYADNQVQIGGDQISYGNGQVMVDSQVVGKYTTQGVLAYGGQDLGTPCRGMIEDNDHPQAFWFFSVNACGAYGFSDLTVFHAGRTAPIGEVTLSSKSKVLKVDKGSAMLLLVGGSGPVETQASTASSGTSSRNSSGTSSRTTGQ